MLKSIKRIYFAFTQSNPSTEFQKIKIPLTLDTPFQYTLNIENYFFHDRRFTEEVIPKHLSQKEALHLQFVMQGFENLLNQKRCEEQIQKEFIRSSLISKKDELLSILKEADIKLQFKFDLNKIERSEGSLQIKPLFGTSLSEENIGFIHQYDMARNRQALHVKKKQSRKTVDLEQQIEDDLSDALNKTHQRKQLQEGLKSAMGLKRKENKMEKVIDFMMSIGKKNPQLDKFQKIYLIDQVKGTMNCSMLHQKKTYTESQIQFQTKWVYLIEHLESQTMKKDRRRVLFDFQFWNRGLLFPVKDFTTELDAT